MRLVFINILLIKSSLANVYFIHHGPSNSTDAIANPFFGVVNKGATDAASEAGEELKINVVGPGASQATNYNYLIDEAIAKNASAIATSVNAFSKPSVDAAVAAGIPVFTFNVGFEYGSIYPTTRGRVQYVSTNATCKDAQEAYRTSSCCGDSEKKFQVSGNLMYVEPPPILQVESYFGQDDFLAGQVAGERAKQDGVTSALCILHEPFAQQLVNRCNGYTLQVPDTTVIDVLQYPAYFSMFPGWPGDPVNDPLMNKTVEILKTHPGIAVQTLSPVHCLYFATAIAAHNVAGWTYVPLETLSTVYLSCFDMFPDPNWFNNIKQGIVKFTIDQGAYLQGYHSIKAAILKYKHGIKHYGNILTGPRVVDASNVASVEAAAMAGYA